MERMIISDIPTPWREPVFQRVYDQLDGGVRVVYFKGNEKRRQWTFKMGSHPKTVLRAITFGSAGTERFFNPGLVPLLLRHRPRVAIVFASIKDPSGWVAMLLCRLLGTKVALLDDSWLGRDRGAGPLRRFARRIAYRCCGHAFVGTSRQTLAMFRHYNPRLRVEQSFLSHLVADNEYFRTKLAGEPVPRCYDVMFSGRIVELKNPVFFARVCAEIKARLGRCRALVIGDGKGPLKEQMRAVFSHAGVECTFAGFITHDQLPQYYARARLLLAPTSRDCWGVVLNEAMVSGTPVITTEWTAAAGELVMHGTNGYVLPLDVRRWAEAACGLLTVDQMWQAFSARARAKVSEFNYDNAATGLLAAFNYLEAPPAHKL